MCDYSLHTVQSRPARARDHLETTAFPGTRSRGFCEIGNRSVAVCLQPGTELAFDRAPARAGVLWGFLARFGIGRIKSNLALFRKLNPDYDDTHHDAIEFADGTIVFLTDLQEGEGATIVQLPALPTHAPPLPLNEAQPSPHAQP